MSRHKDRFLENWDDIKDDMQHLWEDLTEDELDIVDGDVHKLYGLMREKYGKSPEELDDYLDSFEE